MADGWYFWILAYIVELKTTCSGFHTTLLARVGQKLIRHINTQMTSTKCLSDTEFSEAQNILGNPWKASYKLCSENLLEIHFIFFLLSSVYCCTRNTLLLCKMKFKNEQSLFKPCLARLQICNHLPANVSLSAELSITRILFYDLSYSPLISTKSNFHKPTIVFSEITLHVNLIFNAECLRIQYRIAKIICFGGFL